MMKLTEYKVLTFDCYGTLIDWEAGIYAALQPLLAKAARPPSRTGPRRTTRGTNPRRRRRRRTMIYSEVLGAVIRRLANEWGVAASDAEAKLFGESVPDWPAFPDSAEALTISSSTTSS